MKKTILLGLITSVLHINVALAAETAPPAPTAEGLYLEGISVLGPKRTAHLVYQGESLSLKPGEAVGEWIVEKIEQRSVLLRPANAPEDADVKLKQLSLHDRIDGAPAAPQAPNPFAAAVESQAKSTEPPEINKFKPRRIPDDQIPPGQRRIRTPFGDVLVKDENQPQPMQ